MSSGGSPYRKELKSGGGGSDNDPFDIISTKSAFVDKLGRWRVNISIHLHYFRITFIPIFDLKEEEKKEENQIQGVRAAGHFQAAGEKPDGTPKAPPSPIPTGDYDVSPEQLASMTRDHDFSALQTFGGVKGLAEKLKTNPDKGIHEDESDILDRKNVFGSNTYPRKKGRSFWRFLLDACRDTTLIILMVAAAASLALGIKTEGIKEGWYDGGSIALAVIIVIAATAVSDYKNSLQFQNLNEEKQNIQLEVVRGGRRVSISIFDIVVGDVIPLKIGDQVPADGVLISGHSISIDESSMTGESQIVHKDHKSPFLMSGCKVADGYGTMLVTSVGINTEWGLLMASISEYNGLETPLQVRLNGVATFIGIVGIVVAVSVLAILLIRFFTGHSEDEEGRVEFIAGKTSVWDAVDGAIKIFTVAVTIVVVAVPEGLPLAVTLTLAYSMRKMMADKALVRRLSACETMGSATTICSDKTGTLTLNLMTVVEAYICGKKVDPPNNIAELPSRIVSLVIESVAQNTTGSVFLSEGGKDVEISGSPTEKAILQWGVNLGMDFEVARSESSIIHAFPFNSDKKRGGVAVRGSDSVVHVHWKGAAEIVLAACTRYMDDNEQLVLLDDAKVEYYKKAIEDMASGSLRCVAIAYRPLKGETVPSDEEELTNWELPETDLVLLAIVGLKDPCRPGVREAVQLCVKAGVKVRMVTGDNLQTAKAIALECGILGSHADTTEPNLIEGKSFRAMSEAQRLDVADRISVMGRSSPNDKLLLVQALRKRGHVVAVTGDGTNDAPALHEADIGLAMGIAGTEVAKESSDIIILDDNFSSVVKVVRWGRSVYANIQKFIQFHLTVNVAALVINFVAAVSSGDVPLNAVQLLWVNLIMDTLGALALATEPPTNHLMDRHPVGHREPLITNIMWRNLLIQAFYQVSVLLVLNFGGRQLLHSQHDPNEHATKEKNTLIFNAFVTKEKNTLIFNAFVFAQIFNEFNARKPDEMNVFKGVTKNRLFMGIVGLTVVLQVLIVMFLGKFTSTVRLSWQLWLVSMVIGIISWPLAVVGKLIPVPEKPFGEYITGMFARCTRHKDREDLNKRKRDDIITEPVLEEEQLNQVIQTICSEHAIDKASSKPSKQQVKKKKQSQSSVENTSAKKQKLSSDKPPEKHNKQPEKLNVVDKPSSKPSKQPPKKKKQTQSTTENTVAKKPHELTGKEEYYNLMEEKLKLALNTKRMLLRICSEGLSKFCEDEMMKNFQKRINDVFSLNKVADDDILSDNHVRDDDDINVESNNNNDDKKNDDGAEFVSKEDIEKYMHVEDVHLDSDDTPVVGGEELVEEEDQQEVVYDDASLSEWFEANANEEYGPSQPPVSHTIEEASESLGVLVDVAVNSENVEKDNSPKTAQQILPKRQLKLPPVCRSPYINKKTVVNACVSGSEFSLCMEMFSMLEDPNEIVFQTQDRAVNVHRLTLESMCPILYVEAGVIDLWSFLLNCEEKFKNPQAPSRFFFTSSVINSDWFDDKKMSKDKKFDLFESNVRAFIGDDIVKMSFKSVDLVFFPIIRHNHFYVLVFDLRVPFLGIIDNTADVSNFILRYKKVCNLVQYVFGKHLQKYQHRIGVEIESLKPYSMKMPWRTRENNVDCGIFTMHHMERYVGQSDKKWSCGLAVESQEQIIRLRKLRMRFVAKILSHEMNICAEKMLRKATLFRKKHSKAEIKLIVLDALMNRENRIDKALKDKEGDSNVTNEG